MRVLLLFLAIAAVLYCTSAEKEDAPSTEAAALSAEAEAAQFYFPARGILTGRLNRRLNRLKRAYGKRWRTNRNYQNRARSLNRLYRNIMAYHYRRYWKSLYHSNYGRHVGHLTYLLRNRRISYREYKRWENHYYKVYKRNLQKMYIRSRKFH